MTSVNELDFMQLFMQPHAGLQEIMQLYEAGRKFNISQILLPMPDYIAALPWEGKNARALLAELYITGGLPTFRRLL